MKKLPEEERKQRLNNYKNEYRKTNYTKIRFLIKKDLAERFKEKCKEDGVQYTKILKDAVDEYLNN